MARTRLLAAGAVLLLAVVVAVAAGPGDQTARAAGAVDMLPDLVADRPGGDRLEVHDYGNGTKDLLVRFDGYVHNAGAGALDVRGSRGDTSTDMTPLQRVFRSDGTYHDDPMPGAQLIYDDGDGHHHWHLQSIARYSLWNSARTQQVAPAEKVGFCLNDSEHVDGHGPADGFYTDANGRQFCKQYHPETLGLFEGVSAGWRDLYDWWLAYQWVVASDVQPGEYWLREDVDTDDIVRESDETNAPAYAASSTTIPGYVAKGITASTPYGQSKQLTLGTDSYGLPGARHFTIVDPPDHGTLSVGTGTDFAGPAVTYTPGAGYSGPDSFTYTAGDSDSPYPRHPAVASVALSVGPAAPSVVIDGAPSSVETGHGAQLHATVAHDSPGVVWSVDGMDGGNAAAGTITSGGFYSAPAVVPASGNVTIAARSLSGAHDERTVTVVPAQVAPPAPEAPPGSESGSAPDSTTAPGSPRKHRRHGRSKHRKRLGPIAAGLSHHVLVLGVTARRGGVAVLKTRVRKRRLGTCRAHLARHQRFACRMFVPPHSHLRKLKVVASLKRHGRLLARRARHGRPLRISHLGG